MDSDYVGVLPKGISRLISIDHFERLMHQSIQTNDIVTTAQMPMVRVTARPGDRYYLELVASAVNLCSASIMYVYWVINKN
mmetsp:Transcript_1924/g.2877  ORF Transcript_1924/g.2877 Transcript_1924/m.2877 type:complete len:81 (-) Transcript_1924:1385-1627(-)